MKKVSKWLRQVSLYCRLEQKNGVDLMCKLTQELAQGTLDLEWWNEMLAATWFIVKDDDIVAQRHNQWECVESKIEGEFIPAKILIQDVLAGRKYIRQARL